MVLHRHRPTVRVHSPGGSTLLCDMATMLKVWRQIENPTQSIDAYLLEEHCCQISSGIWNDGAIGLFWIGHPNKNNKKSSDMRSVTDLKSIKLFSKVPVMLHKITASVICYQKKDSNVKIREYLRIWWLLCSLTNFSHWRNVFFCIKFTCHLV